MSVIGLSKNLDRRLRLDNLTYEINMALREIWLAAQRDLGEDEAYTPRLRRLFLERKLPECMLDPEWVFNPAQAQQRPRRGRPPRQVASPG